MSDLKIALTVVFVLAVTVTPFVVFAEYYAPSAQAERVRTR